MHRLTRKVRFSINPFQPADSTGFNSFASKPAGEGLAVFFELAVTLDGILDKKSGFVVNVLDIDDHVQKFVIPVFSRNIRKYFSQKRDIGFTEITKLLKMTKEKLQERFSGPKVSQLALQLNPLRKIALDFKEKNMIYFSEKFEFAATHKLWSDKISKSENVKLFGKCANPNGHGHNYIVEVIVKTKPGDLRVADYEKIIDENLIRILDHKNLNIDVPHFAKVLPSVEKLSTFAWASLNGKFKKAALSCITIWETEKTSCSYYGK
jgi:6-pyruvoyltetrahydropterin/6-carboxytetrahydropterin synthase